MAVLLAADIATWQKLNVTAFLVAGIARAVDDIMGEPYQDADGTTYLPLIREPVAVLEGDRPLLRQARRRALERELLIAIYTEDMFATTHDEANRATVIGVPGDDLDLVGIAVYGPRNKVDKALKGARLHG